MANKLPKQGKSFRQMKEDRQKKSWSGLTQSFGSVDDLRAAMYADKGLLSRDTTLGGRGDRDSKDRDRWGNYTGKEKKDKGEKNGSCNISACQRPKAIFYNHGMNKYYCTSCARKLNDANRDAVQEYGHPLCTLDPDFIER